MPIIPNSHFPESTFPNSHFPELEFRTPQFNWKIIYILFTLFLYSEMNRFLYCLILSSFSNIVISILTYLHICTIQYEHMNIFTLKKSYNVLSSKIIFFKYLFFVCSVYMYNCICSQISTHKRKIR